MNLPFIIALLAFLIALGAYLWVYLRRKGAAIERPHHKLERHSSNPVISPTPFKEWEANGTLNPAAVEDDEGNVHLLFRAIGDDGVSRIGHAISLDGLNFSDRSMYPVFQPISGYGAEHAKPSEPPEYNPVIYASGGGWAGAEDPRAVRIGDKVYMTYVAFEGWDSVRIALTSIKMDDMKKSKWKWTRPIFISSPKQVSKNWVIFPEKINGKYAVLHSISPNILVDYVDHLESYYGKPIVSKIPHDQRGNYTGRPDFWDNRVRGAGPPPLKTDIGWLLLYQSMDKNDPNKYKVGAMILDMNDPTKILYRSPQPILSPELHYENDGKPGVTYASGAIIKNGKLIVYYGGGDRHVCVAQTPLKEMLEWLVRYGKV